eukprot:CAMPEP_0181288714 /NCGR_PEP_ID=MMETSP1101-20121128/487_1 /TAXON_ID=46948 /ORGANISM="Rhodomonas abbreviata, Strain Caron Lab Isolate" /LENGTH=285 /DNA_ID=CAMNT_0023392869 /DNA_START=218 /DNA_END=1071 /DNA_ORIENTATION=-
MEGARSEGEVPEEISEERMWMGRALALRPGNRQPRIRKKVEMMTWERQGGGDLIEVDLSSVEQQMVEDQGNVRVVKRNNKIVSFADGVKGPEMLAPIYAVWKARCGEKDLAEEWRDMQRVTEWEDKGGMAPAWPMQERLCNVDGAEIIVGIHPMLLSPKVKQGWLALDPDSWTEEQRELVEEAQSLVVYLEGTNEEQTKLVQHLRGRTREGMRVLFVSPKRASGPLATRLPDMLVYAKPLVTLTVKCPIWWGKKQWGRQPGYVTKGGRGATVWAAGPRDRERSLR